MTAKEGGPPGGEARPKVIAAGKQVRPLASTLATADQIPVQLRRRRTASHRLTALDCHRRDPLSPQHDEDLTPAALAAWAAAIAHLLEVGLCPVVPVAVRLARRGAAS